MRVRVRACACDDQTKSVSAPFKSAFEGETPAPGTSTDNTVAKPRTALEAATSDPALEKEWRRQNDAIDVCAGDP